jgi:DNA-binding NtrC family response regulator
MIDQFDALIEKLLQADFFLGQAVEILEKGMIEAVLTRHNNNQSLAAKDLGIHRNTLQRKMDLYGIDGKHAHRKPPARATSRPAHRRRNAS